VCLRSLEGCLEGVRARSVKGVVSDLVFVLDRLYGILLGSVKGVALGVRMLVHAQGGG
jgi:hypothetical protein